MIPLYYYSLYQLQGARRRGHLGTDGRGVLRLLGGERAARRLLTQPKSYPYPYPYPYLYPYPYPYP